MERVEERVQRLLVDLRTRFDQISRAAEADPKAWPQHWQACREQLPPALAIKVVRALAAERPETLAIQASLAELHVRLGDQASATAVVEPLLAKHTNHKRLLRLHAQIADAGQRPDLARTRYQRLLQHHPGDLSALRSLASVCASLRDFPAAIDLLGKVSELEDATPEDHLTLSLSRAKAEDRRLLPAETLALVERFPDEPSMVEQHIACLQFHREFDAAAAFLRERGLKTGPAEAEPDETRLSVREEEDQEILAGLDGYAAKPARLRLLQDAGYLLARSGRQATAVALVEAIAAGEEAVPLLQARAELHLMAEEIPEALTALRRAVALCPNLTNLAQLCRLLIDCGRLGPARKRRSQIAQTFGALPAGKALLAELSEAMERAGPELDSRQAQDPLPPAAERIIFDIGAHIGEDSDFYLRKGFKVVAVEAFPDHVARLRDRFSKAIAAGHYVVEPVAVGARDEMGSFFVHHEKTDWHRAIPDPSDGRGGFREIEVRFSSVDTLLDKYPTPYFVKVDIEGNDHYVMEALTAERRPTYLSFELGPGWEAWLAHLIAVGYRQGQIVDQSRFAELRGPYPAREGRYVWTRFNGHMSGLFGRDLPNRWIAIDELEAAVKLLPYGDGEWYDVHVS